MSYDPDKRKILSILCHGATFINYTGVAIGIPIAILLISDDPVVKENAKESLNFHLNMWIYIAIGVILAIFLIGFAILWLVPIISFILPIFAILSILNDPSQAYRYPFIIHFL